MGTSFSLSVQGRPYTVRLKRSLSLTVLGVSVLPNIVQIFRIAKSGIHPLWILPFALIVAVAVACYFRIRIVLTTQALTYQTLFSTKRLPYDRGSELAVVRQDNTTLLRCFAKGKARPAFTLSSRLFEVAELAKLLDYIAQHGAAVAIENRELLTGGHLKEAITDSAKVNKEPLGITLLKAVIATGFGLWLSIPELLRLPGQTTPLGRLFGLLFLFLGWLQWKEVYRGHQAGELWFYRPESGFNRRLILCFLGPIMVAVAVVAIPILWIGHDSKVFSEQASAANRQRLIKEASQHSYPVGPILGHQAGPQMVTTLAGNIPGEVDGQGLGARLLGPGNLAHDAFGNVYVVESMSDRLRQITPAGDVRTIAGGSEGSTDGRGSMASFVNPHGLAIDREGVLYVSQFTSIRRISQDGYVTTLAGGRYGLVDGKGHEAAFKYPSGLVVDERGDLYVADRGNHCIRRISPDGVVTTIAGTDEAGMRDGVGSFARFSQPTGIAIDSNGLLYVSDGERICKVTRAGAVSTFVTSPSMIGFGEQIAVGPSGEIYVADSSRAQIVRILPDGAAFKLVGNGRGYADGPMSRAKFGMLTGLTLLPNGVLCVADGENNSIRHINLGNLPGQDSISGRVGQP